MMMVMIVVMLMTVMPMIKRMIVNMTVRMVMVVMFVMVEALARPRTARILAEYQRFDRYRHGVGRHTDAAEIDIIEVPQHHAVDHQDFALDV